MHVRHKSVDPRCPRCGLKPALCMCALLPTINTKTHVAFVTPTVENDKSTNTGRLVRACLSNTSVHFYGPDLPELPDRVWPEGYRPLLLFPVRGAQPVSTAFLDRPNALIVLDANWRQASRLRKRFLLSGVAPVTIPDTSPTLYKLRAEPHAGGMSSLEAVARALAVLEGNDVERALIDALVVFQDRTLWTRGVIDANEVTGGIPAGAMRHQSG
jgi:DTW domain-containing protein